MRAERVICRVCGREVAGYTPAGGDGSAVFARPHKDDNDLDKYLRRNWCEGGKREAEPVAAHQEAADGVAPRPHQEGR